MQRALELATLGLGNVSPNPLVGCVVVYQDKIIGEGWHKKFGGPHAEVEAINNVKQKNLLSEATLYVNLEPCSHHGKTPPCADLIIRHQIRKVVIANKDPNPLVAGQGINKLEQAGVEVVSGIKADEGMKLNARFFHNLQFKRPYLVLKWAETSDGFIARENYDSKWISDAYSRRLVHKWRGEEDGILVGTNTGHYDNPQLNVRLWSGRDPVRIVIDRSLRLDPDLNLFDQTLPTLVYNLKKDEQKENLIHVRLTQEGFLDQMLEDLHKRGIHSVLVEGGSMLLQEFIQNNLWEEAFVFKSPQSFKQGKRAPRLINEKLVQLHRLDQDHLFYYQNINNLWPRL